MPTFPRYNSKAQLTTQQPSAQAVEDKSGQITEDVGKMGKTIQDIGVKWGNAIDTIQKTTAQANFKEGMLDIQQRAATDPDYNNSDAYYQEIQKLKAESTKGFSNKRAEIETSIDLDYQAKVGQIQIEGVYKKKMIDVGQASMLRLLDDEIANPTEGMKERIEDILKTQADNGIISREDEYKLAKQYVKKGKFNAFLGNMQENPALTDERLSKNYYEFDVKELRDARSIYESETEKIIANTESDILQAYLTAKTEDEKPTEDFIKAQLELGKVEPEWANSMIKKINNPTPDKKSQALTYVQFQDRAAAEAEKGDKATLKDAIKLMSDTIKAHSEGLLDKSDTEKILADRSDFINPKIEKEAQKVMDKIQPKTWLDRLNFFVDEQAEGRAEIKARMYRDLMVGIGQGIDPGILASKIANDELDIQLADELKKPDTPPRIYAKNPDTGEREAYSEDNGLTFIDIKTGKVRQ